MDIAVSYDLINPIKKIFRSLLEYNIRAPVCALWHEPVFHIKHMSNPYIKTCKLFVKILNSIISELIILIPC